MTPPLRASEAANAPLVHPGYGWPLADEPRAEQPRRRYFQYVFGHFLLALLAIAFVGWMVWAEVQFLRYLWQNPPRTVTARGMVISAAASLPVLALVAIGDATGTLGIGLLVFVAANIIFAVVGVPVFVWLYRRRHPAGGVRSSRSLDPPSS
jgi:hypothetical protein